VDRVVLGHVRPFLSGDWLPHQIPLLWPTIGWGLGFRTPLSVA
jgi:hypothetical protein